MLNKTIVAAVAAAMLGSFGTVFAQGRSGGTNMGAGNAASAQATTPRTTPEAAVTNSNGINAVDRDKGLNRAADRKSIKSDALTPKATAHKVVRHTTVKAKTAHPTKVVHKAAKVTKGHPTKVIHKVNDAPDFRAAQTRDQRMEQARANWEKSRKL